MRRLVVLLFTCGCASPIDLPPMPGAAYLSGRTVVAVSGTDRFAPVAKAEIEIPFTNLHAVTDSEGRFLVGPVEAGRYSVRAHALVDGAARQRTIAGVNVVSGARDVGDVVLRDNAELSGYARANRSSGSGAGTVVFVAFSSQVAVTSGDGSYLLRGLADGPVRVGAVREGFEPLQSSELTLVGGQRTVASDLLLEPRAAGALTTADVKGIVRVAGAAVAGVRVALRRSWGEDRVLETTTDGEGAYLVRGVPVGLWSLRAERSGLVPLDLPNVLVLPPVVDLPTLTLYAGAAPAPDAGEGPVDAGEEVACESAEGCAEGLACVGGLCRACLTQGECGGGRACVAGVCQACANDGECAFASMCEDGACVPGNCRAPADCLDESEACVNRFCSPGCETSGECRAGHVCAAHRCVVGGCITNDDCDDGLVCDAATHACGGCGSDRECGAGRLCFSGVCLTGTCRADEECGGEVCDLSRRTCEPCRDSAQCGAGRVCDEGACVPGTCARDVDCTNGELCVAHVCAPCSADAQCGEGRLCYAGACEYGACHSDADCPGTKACVGRACVGDCRSNADCEGGAFCSSRRLCGACDQDGQCGAGRICLAGTCREGTCHGDFDCRSGEACNAALTCVRVAPVLAAQGTVTTNGGAANLTPLVGRHGIYVQVGTAAGYRTTALDPTTLATRWSADETPALLPPSSGLVLPAKRLAASEELVVVVGHDRLSATGGIVAYDGASGKQVWFVAAASPSDLTAGLVDGLPSIAFTQGDRLSVRRGDGTAILDRFPLPCSAAVGPAFGTGQIYIACTDRLLALDPKTGVTKWSLVHTPSATGTATTYAAGKVTPLSITRPTGTATDIVYFAGARADDAAFLHAIDAGTTASRRYTVALPGLEAPKSVPLVDASGVAVVFTGSGAFARVSATGTILASGAQSGLASPYQALTAQGSLVGFSGARGALLAGLGFDGAAGTRQLWVVDANGGAFAPVSWPVWTDEGDLLVWGTPLGQVGASPFRLTPVGPSRPVAPAWGARGGNPQGQERVAASECASDAQCTAPATCVLGRCAGTCATAATCATGLGCALGACLACTNDLACRSGEICQSGTCWACTPSSTVRCCHDASECGANEACSAGQCQAGPTQAWTAAASSLKQTFVGPDGALLETVGGNGLGLVRTNADGTRAWAQPAWSGIDDFYVFQRPAFYARLPGKSYGSVYFHQAGSSYFQALVRVDAAPTAPVVTVFQMGFPTDFGFMVNGPNGTALNLYSYYGGYLFAWNAETLAKVWVTVPICVDQPPVVAGDGTVYVVCNDGRVQAFAAGGDPVAGHTNSDGSRWGKELWRTTARGFDLVNRNFAIGRLPSAPTRDTLWIQGRRTVNAVSNWSLMLLPAGASAGTPQELAGLVPSDQFVLDAEGWMILALADGRIETISPTLEQKFQTMPVSPNPGAISLSDDGLLYLNGATEYEAWKISPTHDYTRIFGLPGLNGSSYYNLGSPGFLAPGPRLLTLAAAGSSRLWVSTTLRTGTGLAAAPAWPTQGGGNNRLGRVE